MHDSGKRQEFKTGAVRDTADDKPRPDLISPHAHLREGVILLEGSKKYTERNWEKGIPASRSVASLWRHLLAYMLGDTSEDHLAMLRCNTGFLLHTEEEVKAGRLPADLLDMPWYLNQGLCPGFPGEEEVSENSSTKWWGIRLHLDKGDQWVYSTAAYTQIQASGVNTDPGDSTPVALWSSRALAEAELPEWDLRLPRNSVMLYTVGNDWIIQEVNL